MLETSLAAFVGAFEQSVPAFTGPGGIFPKLSDHLGGEESFGQENGKEGRWRCRLENGGRVGEEFQKCWGRIRLPG